MSSKSSVGRIFESGASKRKRKRIKEEELKKHNKVTAFFTPIRLKQTEAVSVVRDQEKTSGPSEIINEPGCSNFGQVSSEIEQETPSDQSEIINEPGCSNDEENKNLILIPDKDPALWQSCINTEFRESCIRYGIIYFHNRSHNYEASERQYKSQKRFISSSVFTRKLANGEIAERNWILYSPSTGNIYCWHCKLLGNKSASFTEGFSDWKKSEEKVSSHENSTEHKNNVLKIMAFSQEERRIDKQLLRQVLMETEYWKQVLRRVVSVIKFLSERGLAFRGANEILGSPNNGIFLGIMDLLSEFDPFLKNHIDRYGNRGRGETSYLSSTIYEEFISLMGKAVLKAIVSQIKEAKYYGLIVDSTPDSTHIDQLSIVVRYCYRGVINERFLHLIPIDSHTGVSMKNDVMNFLNEQGILIQNCRGQSYDNASNMSGKYQGLQRQIASENDKAIYVPCVAHSLNLVGVSSVDSCTEAVAFFDIIQRIYVFFSSSTHRWKVLFNNEEGKMHSLKTLCATRWSRHFESCKAIEANYSKIMDSLSQIEANDNEKADTRCDAKALFKKMCKLEIAFLTIFWSKLLERANATSKQLQKLKTDLITAANLLEALKSFVHSFRNTTKFEELEQQAKHLDERINQEYADERKRKIKKKFPDGQESEEAHLSGKKKFEIETFIVIIDKFASELERRQSSYRELCQRFQFLYNLELQDNMESLRNDSQKLRKWYPDDLENCLEEEIVQLSSFLKVTEPVSSDPISLYTFLYEKDLCNVFPNVLIALRIYLSMPITNCEAERSFSKLGLVKNKLRASSAESRLNNLMLLSIESEFVRNLSFDSLISEFASAKV